MIPAANLTTVAPVGKVAPAAPAEAVADARQQEFQRALAGLVGKSMPASVLSRLTDGSFLVRVAGATARMALPSMAQPGASLALTLVALTPRPTFQLTNSPQSAAISAFAEPELYTPAAGAVRRAAPQGEAPSAPAPADDTPGSQSTLSATARVISSVLGAAARSEHAQTEIVAPLPLLAAPSDDPVKLAAQLKDAIGASGLFYESHVAEWSAGKRALADLQREPQMQRMQAQPEAGHSPAADPATAQFINLQLTSQEQARVAWQGQLWPGQDMAWQISRDPPDARGQPEDAAGQPWRSALRLRFAALGEIGATVVLTGDKLHIQLQAGSDQLASVLRARAGELQRSLEASGSTLASLTVSAGEHGND